MRTIVHLPSAVLHANVSGATDAASTAKQWVLLLHGFPDSAAMWDSQVEALVAAGYAVLAPDMPGLGDGSTLLTPPPSELRSYRLRNIAAVMVQLLDCLGISSTTVVGHDWGAAVAWALAMQHPHRVERLVVMSVGHPGAVKDQRQLAAWWYQVRAWGEGAGTRETPRQLTRSRMLCCCSPRTAVLLPSWSS
jgi:pimeloyl-ACP methyl ester carboxylesterase